MSEKINIVIAAQTGGAIKGLDQVTSATKRTGQAVERAKSKMDKFSMTADQARIKTRKFAMGGLQQAGYQIGDYAVQVANGTSKMQAFGQQAPQLLQIFGPIGAVVGAGVAIFAAFAVALDRTKKAAQEAKLEIVSLDSAFTQLERLDFASLGENMSAPAQAALDTYSELLSAMREYANEQRDAALSEIMSDLFPIEKLQGLREDVQEASDILQDATSDLDSHSQAEIAAIVTAKELQAEALRKLQAEAAVRKVILSVQGKTRQEAAENLRNARNQLVASGQMTDAINGKLLKYAEEFNLLGEIEKQVRKVADAAKDDEEAASKVIDLANAYKQYAFTRGRSDAQTAAAELANIATLKAAYMQSGFSRMKSDAQAAVSELESQASVQAAYQQYGALRALSERMAESQNAEIRERQTAGWAQYYQSRVNGEILVAKAAAAAAAAPQVGRSRGVGGPTAAELEMNSAAVQLAKAEADAKKRLQEITDAANAAALKGIKAQTNAVDNELSPALQRLKSVQDSVSGSIENGLMAMVDGTKSVKDAFKSMAVEIIKELYRIFVVKQITGMISGAIGGYFNTSQVSGPSMPLGTGNVRPPQRYDGGGYTGGGARSGGLDGKGGFMAMLHPRETVIDHTKGQGSGGVVVNQTINVSTGVQQTVRTEIKTLMPQIAEAAKSAVVDAKRRGGSYGRAMA